MVMIGDVCLQTSACIQPLRHAGTAVRDVSCAWRTYGQAKGGPRGLQKMSPGVAARQKKTAARNVLAAADRGTGTSNNAQTYQAHQTYRS
jgi:hypothetical protein